MGPSSSANQNGTQSSIFDSLKADDFINHPNFHILAPFFAGFVFWSSLSYLARSPFSLYLLRISRQLVQPLNGRVRNATTTRTSYDTEAQISGSNFNSEKEQARRSLTLSISESIYRRGENPTLVFALTLLFLMSSFSQFLSTLTLSNSSSSDAALCAFFVAWDSMSSQSARLLGLFIIGLVFKTLLTKRWELWTYWGVLAIITVLVFVTNALSTGTVQSTKDYTGGFNVNLCYRRHFLPTSIVVSLLSLSIETYSIFRLLFIIAPPSFPLQRRLDALSDVRILRMASLVLFDMIIMVPNAINTTYAGDTVPYSVAALIVLYTFNSLHSPSDFILQELPRIEVPPSRNPSVRRTRPASIEVGELYMGRHPFSATALADNSSQQDIWRTARISSITLGSIASTQVARSVKDAVVQTATRDRFTPSPRIPAHPPSRRRSRSKSRSSREGQSSSSRSSKRRSLKQNITELVRPIISRSELERKVSDNPATITTLPPNVLAPPPHRSRKPPSQPPPPIPIDTAKKQRGFSMIDSAPGTARSLYGSDIIRPKSGQRNKMKHMPTTSNGSSGGSITSVGTTGTVSKTSMKSVETVRASGISARTMETQQTVGTSGTVAFGDEWPLPPEPVPPLPVYVADSSSLPAPVSAIIHPPSSSPSKRMVGLPANPRSSPPKQTRNLPDSKRRSKPTNPNARSAETSNMSTRIVSPPRPTRIVRGPRPPPNSPGMASRFSGWTESDTGD